MLRWETIIVYSFEAQPTVKLNLQEESEKMIQLKIFQNKNWDLPVLESFLLFCKASKLPVPGDITFKKGRLNFKLKGSKSYEKGLNFPVDSFQEIKSKTSQTSNGTIVQSGVLSRDWHFGFETSRFRDFANFVRV